jgi:hypothetical protein
VSAVLVVVAIVAIVITVSVITGWTEPAEPIDGLIDRMNCGACRAEPYSQCGCSEDCGHRFCRWAPPLTGLTREDNEVLEGKRAL